MGVYRGLVVFFLVWLGGYFDFFLEVKYLFFVVSIVCECFVFVNYIESWGRGWGFSEFDL